jgi:hypothetical protein
MVAALAIRPAGSQVHAQRDANLVEQLSCSVASTSLPSTPATSRQRSDFGSFIAPNLLRKRCFVTSLMATMKTYFILVGRSYNDPMEARSSRLSTDQPRLVRRLRHDNG